MAATGLVSKQLEKGSLVYVKYLDHSWFRNAEPEAVAPIVQEAYGRLDRDEPGHITVVAASYLDPSLKSDSATSTET